MQAPVGDRFVVVAVAGDGAVGVVAAAVVTATVSPYRQAIVICVVVDDGG